MVYYYIFISKLQAQKQDFASAQASKLITPNFLHLHSARSLSIPPFSAIQVTGPQ